MSAKLGIHAPIFKQIDHYITILKHYGMSWIKTTDTGPEMDQNQRNFQKSPIKLFMDLYLRKYPVSNRYVSISNSQNNSS